MNSCVYLSRCKGYQEEVITAALVDELFVPIRPGQTIVMKPNWVKESHLKRVCDWDYVITHPVIITAVLKAVAKKLRGRGRIIIADGPQTDSSFEKILSHYPVEHWKSIAQENDIDLQILDLREDEWVNEGDVTVQRKKLPGDPKGTTEVNLLNNSEFSGQKKSMRGYYGADYNLDETNKAHDGENNLYRVSRTIIEADVFINLPKLKTHKKAGITGCLKNLVGINTYKNFLPHHMEGSPIENGDQFPKENFNSKIEGPLIALLKQHLLQNTLFAKLFKPFKTLGKKIFGDTNTTIRSGNWYGNDTAWRMILDLSKILFFSNPDGSMRQPDWLYAKNYIGIVDGVLVGEGNGPMAPDPKNLNCLICGNNPAAIDAVCARLMGFDPLKIPTIRQAFSIKRYPFVNFSLNDIQIYYDGSVFNLQNLPKEIVVPCEPHFGWKNHIEMDNINES